jgi:segregation and condensation protein A
MADNFLGDDIDFIFELDAFDGPLDLLLYLIKREEIDIYDIPIAEITRQYLDYLAACEELNLELAGEFLYMAALLIRIQAQMLIPRPEDEEVWEDPRTELVKALLEYKKIKQVSTVLDEMAENMRRRYFRKDFSAWNVSKPEPELLKVDLAALMIAFGDVLRRAEAVSTLEIRPQEITVESRKEYILSLLKSNSGVEFEDLFGDDPRKIVLVVTFIALLDLVKDGILRIEQADRFSTIRVYVNNREPALIEES